MSNKEFIKNLLPKRAKESNKWTFGHVLNVAGSKHYKGAAYFSSIAALKVGCGLSTLASEETVLQTISTLCPDTILASVKHIDKKFLEKFQAISIGCGLSIENSSIKLFKKIIENTASLSIPIVIDADGLNILALNEKFFLKLQKRNNVSTKLIFTPHIKELSRLMKVDTEQILENPEFWAKKCCEKYSCITVLKTAKTIVTDGKDKIYVNTTGNSALSHGGSGDVLTGMIAGFLAQGVQPFEAGCLAVYLHGLTGELASKDLSEYSTLASDLIKYIPQAIKSII